MAFLPNGQRTEWVTTPCLISIMKGDADIDRIIADGWRIGSIYKTRNGAWIVFDPPA